MSDLRRSLEARGCDMEQTMERFLNDEEFYVKCYQQALADGSFEALGKALENHENQQAFEFAHTLKGVLANMGITPLYELVVQIVEPLRAGDDENLLQAYKKLMEKRAEFQTLV